MKIARLIAVNGLIRVAAAASGQFFAFFLAERLAGRLGVGSFVVGLLGASFFVTELLGAPVAGGIADRVGQRRILRYGPAFGAASALLAATAAGVGGAIVPLVAVLLFARIAEGSSAACAVPTTLVLLSRETRDDPVRRTRVMGGLEITSMVGMIGGYVVAGVGWDVLGVRAFLLLPPLYLVAWLLVPRGEERPAGDAVAGTAAHALRRLGSVRGAMPFGVAWLAVNAVVGLWLQYAPFLMKSPTTVAGQRLVGGLSGGQIGVVFGVWGLTFLVGIALWSLFGGRLPKRRILAIALVGMLGVVTTLTMANHGSPAWVLMLSGVFVLVESGYTPAAFAHLADLTEQLDDARGAALGVYSLLLGLGQLAGSTLGAPFVARWQMDGVLLLTALLALTSLAGVVLMGPTPVPRSAAEPRQA